MDLPAARELKARLLTDAQTAAGDGPVRRDFAVGDVDIRTVGIIRPQAEPDVSDLQSRQRPIYPGLSVGHPDVTAGTLGGS